MRKDPIEIVSATLEATERCGTLDKVKKDLIICLINRGASRREAAAYVKCHHTTIGRAAARDAAFAAKLSQVEMAGSLATNGMIRRAATDPKYWRAAAWMLERRNPEDYAKRAPHTFTADQVVSLLASVCSAAVKTVQPEKVEEFYKFFDDAFDEVEAKAGPADKVRKATDEEKEDKKKAEATQTPAQNGHSPSGATPSRNGHHPPQAPPAAEVAALAPEPPAPPAAASARRPSPALNDGAETPSEELAAETFVDEDAATDGEFEDDFDQEFGTDDDANDGEDDLDFDWDRVDQLQDAECRYVSADVEPDPVKRVAADRLVRLELARQQLERESNRKSMHHPLDRLSNGLTKDSIRNTLSHIELHRQAKSCTSAEKAKGRCTNEAESEGCDAVPAAAAAAVSG